MKKLIPTATLGVGVTALTLIGASAAYAAGTYVSVNGSTTIGTVSYSATNDTPAIAFNTNYGTKMTCSTASISGNLIRGMEVTPSNVIGTINGGSLDCIMSVFQIGATITGAEIEVHTDPAAPGGDVPVSITSFHAHFDAASCSFEADGSLNAILKPGSGGKDATLELVSADFGPPESGFDLEISNVSGCGGEVLDGDLLGAWDSDKVNGIPSAFEIDTAGVVTHN